MSIRPRRALPFSAPLRVALVSFAFSLLLGVPVLLFVYQQTDTLFEDGIRSRIDERQAALAQGYKSAGTRGLARIIREEIDAGMVRSGAVLLTSIDGRKIVGNLGAWPPTLRVGEDWDELRLYPEGSRQAFLYALRTMKLPTGERLLLGTSIEDRERMRSSLFEALIGALLLAVPLGLIGGMMLLRVTERRVRAVGSIASRIAAGDFSHRLDDQAEGEEFALIATAINAMLARIEELVEQLRLVTDSLAHDLRSPLTRMRANLEKAARYSSAAPEQQALDAISSDIDRLLRLISATLELSRMEAGVGREQFVDFDASDLVRDICEIYQPIAEDNDQSISLEGGSPVPFVGNRQMIGRAVANLVDNALKYAPGSTITIGSRDLGEIIELVVSDRGPGIPPDLREPAMHKYRRLEESRTTEGSGLGLAMARAVARLHSGDIALEDNCPGLRARMILRRASEQGSGNEGLHASAAKFRD